LETSGCISIPEGLLQFKRTLADTVNVETVTSLSPFSAAITIQFLLGLILVWGFYRFDAVAAYVALLTAKVLDKD
jgi:hypothetical protein